MKRLGIIIVTYRNERQIGPLLRSLAATIDRAQTEIWILDNASPDATLAAIESENAALELPLHIIRSETNHGFPEGNNVAFAALRAETPCEFIALLNPDTYVHDGWWQPLVAALDDSKVGTVAPLLLLPDGTVNSRGNGVHFLGLGFVLGYGEPISAMPAHPAFFSCSGAALAFRVATLDAVNAKLGGTGILWGELFFYTDDTDLGWRMRLAGLENRLALESRVTHDHAFRFALDQGPQDRLFWIERNRYLLMFANFKVATLVVLAPWVVASELALALGVWKLHPHRVPIWRSIWTEVGKAHFQERRRAVQAGRVVPDRDILRAMTGSIRHGALPFRGVDRWLDAALRASHRLLIWLVRW